MNISVGSLESHKSGLAQAAITVRYSQYKTITSRSTPSCSIPSVETWILDFKSAPIGIEINAAFKKAAEGPLKGVLEYTDAPIVSSDIITNPHSCVFDSDLTMTMGNLVKVLGWYDNEWGYSNRLVDLTKHIGSSK